MALLFFLIAILYSSIGFGGGSSYIALMLLFKLPYAHIPIIALICNLIVVTGSSVKFLKKKYITFKQMIPFISSSIPAAYFGGQLEINAQSLKLVLGVCLFIAGFKMIFNLKGSYDNYKLPNNFLAFTIGALLGFISGVVGIGGGIFLSPIMYFFRWGNPKQIAAICSLFILFNSSAGLIGQLQKANSLSILSAYWPLFICVLLGGQIGNYLITTKLKPRIIETLTSVLVLFISLRILFLN